MQAGLASAVLIGCALSGVSGQAARAEIKDYQIARMLNFRTECHLHALKRLPPRDGEIERFAGECGNKTFYPDGIEISCPEADDEWACKVITQKRNFENLDLLRPRE